VPLEVEDETKASMLLPFKFKHTTVVCLDVVHRVVEAVLLIKPPNGPPLHTQTRFHSGLQPGTFQFWLLALHSNMVHTCHPLPEQHPKLHQHMSGHRQLQRHRPLLYAKEDWVIHLLV
jgi:hypothetical protein